ncbi:hypothetical protein [Umezawaea sp.]|uniref:hypothetical protein n=1 Tax=Umezawaea sp. TaxID=1955258 RepID=UPI002ED54708
MAVPAVRDGEPCPDASTSSWKEGQIERVELSPAAVGGLLDRALDDALDQVSQRSGNSLPPRETPRSGVDSGSLRHRHGVWRWAGVERPTRSPSRGRAPRQARPVCGTGSPAAR